MTGPSFLASVVLVHVLAAALTAGLGVYVYRTSWRKPIGKVFTAMVAAFSVWTVFSLCRLFVTDPAVYVGVTTVKYVGVTTAPVFFFLFGLVYAGGEQYVRARTVAALLVVPAVSLAVLVTTLHHGLFYSGFETRTVAGMTMLDTSRGWAFWAFAAYGWGLLAVGSALLAYGGYRLPALYRTQAVVVGLGILVPWVVSVGYIGFDWPHPTVDTTPLGFAVASGLWAVGVFGTSLVDVSPVARSRVVSTIDDPVVVLDGADRVTDVNEAARPLLEAEPPYGRPVDEVIPDAVAARVSAAEPVADGGTEQLELTLNGERRYYRSRLLPLGSDGRRGAVLVLTDVTELTAMRRELEERNRALERQNERLDEFASIVSHDLRNPLTVAKGNLELLAEEADTELVGEVRRSHERMEALVDELLELARHGRAVGDAEEVQFRAVATDAWRNVDAPAATLTVADDLGTVEADRSRLAAVFENLFRNAVEHAGEAVTVHVGATDDGFYVADDGPGIPPEERAEVFDHGYTTSDEGTGFGLNIVQTVVQAHGWDVEVSASDDGGARFDVHVGRDDVSTPSVMPVEAGE